MVEIILQYMHSTGYNGVRDVSMGNASAVSFFRFYIPRTREKIQVWLMQFPIF